MKKTARMAIKSNLKERVHSEEDYAAYIGKALQRRRKESLKKK